MSDPPVGLVALGVHFTVVGLSATDKQDFLALWGPCLADRVSGDAVHVRIRRTGSGWSSETDGGVWELSGEDAGVAAASSAVNAVATSQTTLLATHAAVLSKNGLTAVVPGSSGTGKSTLALALMQRGWAYTSDEAFAMDRATGEVHHYARPVAIADWPRRTLGLSGRGRSSAGETYLAAPDIGGAYELQPGSPGLLVLRSRDRGAAALQAVHRMDGLEALLRRSFTMHVDPGMALRMLADVTRRCDVVRLSGGSPDQAAARIDALAG